MPITKEEQQRRQEIIDDVNHDLYLENVEKADFQHELDRQWIRGKITQEEQNKIELEYILSEQK